MATGALFSYGLGIAQDIVSNPRENRMRAGCGDRALLEADPPLDFAADSAGEGLEAELKNQASKEVYNHVLRSNYLYPKGGYTKVELTHPVTGRKYIGECHFDIHTIFDKKLANSRAFGKMFSKMLEDSSMGRRHGKQVINALLA